MSRSCCDNPSAIWTRFADHPCKRRPARPTPDLLAPSAVPGTSICLSVKPRPSRQAIALSGRRLPAFHPRANRHVRGRSHKKRENNPMQSRRMQLCQSLSSRAEILRILRSDLTRRAKHGHYSTIETVPISSRHASPPSLLPAAQYHAKCRCPGSLATASTACLRFGSGSLCRSLLCIYL